MNIITNIERIYLQKIENYKFYNKYLYISNISPVNEKSDTGLNNVTLLTSQTGQIISC